MKLYTPALVAFFALFATGAAVNIEQSGNSVDTPKEAIERIVDAVKEGYNQSVNTTFDLNE
tara:strand:- start:261 stop:443 length:183 start_codon:yes stop_codon:yes gene_type:complete